MMAEKRHPDDEREDRDERDATSDAPEFRTSIEEEADDDGLDLTAGHAPEGHWRADVDSDSVDDEDDAVDPYLPESDTVSGSVFVKPGDAAEPPSQPIGLELDHGGWDDSPTDSNTSWDERSTDPALPADGDSTPPPPELPKPDLLPMGGTEEFDPAGVGTVFGSTLDLAGLPRSDEDVSHETDTIVQRTDADEERDVDRTVVIGGGPRRAGGGTVDMGARPPAPEDTGHEDIRGSFLDGSDIGRTIDPSKLPERDREVWRRLLRDQQSDTLDSPLDTEATDRKLIIQQRRVRNTGDSDVHLADYQVVNAFAEGGMGKIYLARQQSVNRTVAVKMLKPEFEDDARQREGFLSEAVVTSDLDHPNIVPIHDLGRTEEHQLFYSMKLVSGTPWSAVLLDRTLAENLEIWMKVADGVAFAHSRGVVHRDLKPENVMLGDYGEVLVMDWGLAVVTDSFEKPESIRRTNSRGGSPAYMAPEMVTGPVRRIEPRADVYLLGAILYEVVTGHPPHSGSNVSECIRAAAGNVILPTTKRGELVDIALKAMETLPEDRYESVVAMQEAVRAYQSHSESLVLSNRAAEELETARESREYEDFARSVFGFEEAASLWAGNVSAREGARRARYEYASTALDNQDFDLGISTLDPDVPEHAPLLAKLEDGRRASRARQGRIRTLFNVASGLAVLLLVGAGVALFVINSARQDAIDQKGIADAAAIAARESEALALEKEALAVEKEQEARENLLLAEKNEKEARDNLELANEKTAEAQENLELAKANETEARENLALANTNLAAAKQAAFQSWVNEQKSRINQREAEVQRAKAVDESEKALLAQAEARRQELDALFNGYATSLQEEAARLAADDATRKAIEAAFQEHLADIARAEAQDSAIAARNAAEEAQRARQAQEYEAYIAQIQLAAERIDDGSFRVAGNILAGLEPRFRGWEWYRLSHVTRLQDWTKDAPDDVAFESVVLHPDGRTFAVACDDGDVRIWRTAGGDEPVATLVHEQPVLTLAFSPSGELVTGTTDGSIHRWSATEDGYTRAASVRKHEGPVTAITFASDDRWATGSARGDVLVWQNGEVTGEPLRRHRGAVRDVSFLGKANRLVSAGDDGRAVVWSLVDGKPRIESEFLGHGGRPILSIAYGARLDRVATGGDDGRILLWDPSDPGRIDIEARIRASLGQGNAAPADEWKFVSLEPTAGTSAHGDGVRTLRFSADGTKLVSGSADRTIRVWELLSRETPHLVKTLEGHGDAVESLAVVGADANAVLSIDATGARFWNVARYREKGIVTERVFKGHDGAVTSARFDPATGRIVSTSVDHTVRRWNTENGHQLATYRDGHDVLATTGSFVSLEGREDLIATAAAFVGEVRLWDVATGAERVRIAGTGRNAALAVSPDGRWLATGGDGNRVLLWDVRKLLADGPNAKPTHSLRSHATHVSAVAFSPDARRLYSGDDEGVVLEWTIGNDTPNRVGAHWGRVNGIAVLPGGDVLTASTDKTIERWQRTDGGLRKLEQPLAHPGSVVALAVATDGKSFVSVARDESRNDTFELRRWDTGTNAVTKRFAIGAELVSGVALDPSNADRVITVEGGEDLRLWSISTGQTEQPRIPAWSAAFSPSGDRILTVGGSSAELWSFGEDGLGRLRSFEPHGTVNDADHSADGRFVASVGSEGALKIWPAENLTDETPSAAYTVTSGQPVEGGTMHRGGVTSVDFLPAGPRDGAYELVTAGVDGAVKLWKWMPGEGDGGEPTVELLHTWIEEANKAPIRHVAFSHDGNLIVAAHDDGRARVWSQTDLDAKPIELLSGTDPLRAAAFSPESDADGNRLLAVAGDDDTIRLWTIKDGAGGFLSDVTGHGADVTALAWSPDGRRLLSGSRDGTAKVWDTPLSRIEEAGRNAVRELLTLDPDGERSAITTVDFSPPRPGEPLNVLTGSENGTLTLWMADPIPAGE